MRGEAMPITRLDETRPQRRPRVIYVTHMSPWLPRYGIAMRCEGILRGLAEIADVHVVLAADDPDTIAAFRGFPAGIHGIRRSVLEPSGGLQPVPDYRASRSLAAIVGPGKYGADLASLCRQEAPDLLWYFEAESLHRALPPHRTTVVLDLCDVRWRKQRRLSLQCSGIRRAASYAKAVLMRIDDVALALGVDRALVCSPEELGPVWPAANVQVLPNGYDFPSELVLRHRAGRRLLFYGSLLYGPNADAVRWFCSTVWPTLEAACPDVELDVIGLGGEQLREGLASDRIRFHGFVENLDPYIDSASALIVPLRLGGGTRVKILEAWAKGLPVITTTTGCEGLGARDEEHVLIADDAHGFALQCKRVLDDDALRASLASSAHAFGRSQYGWDVIHRQIADLVAAHQAGDGTGVDRTSGGEAGRPHAGARGPGPGGE